MLPPVLSADELRGYSDTDVSTLQESGILRPAEPASSQACVDCGAFCSVRFEACGNTVRGYIFCAECGQIDRVEPARLRRWLLDPATLLAAIFRAVVVNPIVTELARPLWHLGNFKLQGRATDLLFALTRQRDTDSAALNIVLKRPRSLLFVPTESDVATWARDVGNTVIALQAVTAWNDGHFSFDRSLVETVLADRPARVPAPRKQTRRRSARTAKIEALKQELIKHVRDARDHAIDTRDRTGEAQLLPCPTREEFARLAGVAPYDVTRCFQDDAGSDLRTLWNVAHDLNRLLYRGD